MSTENLEKKPSGTDRLKRLGKVSTQPQAVPQNIVEQTPPWLKQLLAKYGEREGRLVGLGEGYGTAEGASMVGTGELPEAGLSALLEQMAEEGVDQFPQDRLATSVEWGSYDSASVEPSAAPIDDLLAGLSGEGADYPDTSTQYGQTVTADMEAPDWLTSPDEPVSGYPSTAPGADEGPDWLTEMMTSDEPAPPSRLPFPTEEDVPDWLADALETPTAVTDISPPSPAPSPTPTGAQDYDIPDWLSETLESTPSTSSPPAAVPEYSPPPAEPTQSDFEVSDWFSTAPAELTVPETEQRESTIEVPDWLAEMAPPVTDEPAPPPPTGAEPATLDWQVPDWIATGTSEEQSTATSEETPSWLTQPGQPGQDLLSLDWLFEETAPQAAPEAEPSAPAEESPDWLSNEPASSSAASFEPPATPSTSGSPSEVPSWLADMEIPSSPSPVETSPAIPDWLENMQGPVEQTAVTSDQPPDWLESFQIHPTEAAEAEEDLPAWLTTPDETSTETESTARPVSGLKRLKPLKRLTPQPKPLVTPPLPDWVASLVPAEAETDQTSTTLPAWTASLVPPGATSPGVSAVDLPDWARTLIPPGVTAPPTLPTETPSAVTTHRPLQRLGPISKPAPTPSPETIEAEAPSWSLPLEPTVEEVGEAAAEPDDWLRELSPDSDETPDWMAELSASVPIEPATTEDSWLESSTEDDQLLATRLDWFTQTDSDQVSEAPLSQEDKTGVASDTLDWLTETPEPTPTEVEPTPPFPADELETEAEGETLDWLDNLPSPTASSEAAASTYTGETEVEAEIPDWSADLSKATPSETIPPPVAPASPIEAEAEFGIPDWLAKLPEEAIPAAPVDRVETETEVETASWLADLPPLEETPPWLSESTETTPSPQIGEATDLETPSWLTDLEIPTSEAITEPEAELEIPTSLTESAEMPVAESVSSTFAEEVETEEEAETPSWLTELSETAPFEVAPPTSAETEPETERGIPPWLAELPETPTLIETTPTPESELEAEPEIPSWLAGLRETSATTEATPDAFIDEAESGAEVETSPWLAESPEAPPTEAETEIPPRLVELSETPATEIAPATPVDGTEAEEEELPLWLADLSTDELKMPTSLARPTEAEEVTQAEDETPSGPAELPEAPSIEKVSEPEEELVMPSWLSELPEAPAIEPASVEPMSEAETPPWLTESPEAPTTEAAVSEPEEELAMPSWLSELPEAPAIEPASVEPMSEAETPPWLTESPEAPTTEAAVSEAEEELVMPSWLTRPAEAEEVAAEAEQETLPESVEVSETPLAEAEPTAPMEVVEEELPPWLADLFTDEELKMPSWLTGTPEAASIEASLIEATVEESQVSTELEAPVEQAEVASEVTMTDVAAASPVEAEPTDTEVLPEAEWLSSSPVADAVTTTPAVDQEESLDFVAGEEPELPGWLQDEPKTARPAEMSTTTSEWGELPDIEPEAPDWLKDIGDSPAPTSDKTEPQTEAPASVAGGVAITATAAVLTETPLAPVGRMSDWLRNLKPTEETLEAEDTGGASESTGVLTGLTPLLPVERMVTALPPLAPQATATTAQADAVQEAARHFFAIATQTPQPAVLPESLTQREQLTGRMVRAALYLLFILLLALPLVPGWQKVVDPATDRKVPWTEPAGTLGDILDKQRLELVSEQLGVIDLQQPSSVALVSFDYSTATQGEMQSLAEDVISRLLGQGMRLIFVSLEPEGAALAQRTLDRLLTERNEAYGVNMVNLGYVPGQVAGVRELLTGRKQLAAIPDFQEGLTFAAPERANWSDISNLGQVDIIVTLADNPVAARWWIEQMAMAVPTDDGERYLLAATSATADPFLRPYLESQQLNGLLSGVNGAAAIEAGRQNFGPARQMLDSQSIAHLLIVILIALGTMVGWMPATEKKV